MRGYLRIKPINEISAIKASIDVLKTKLTSETCSRLIDKAKVYHEKGNIESALNTVASVLEKTLPDMGDFGTEIILEYSSHYFHDYLMEIKEMGVGTKDRISKLIEIMDPASAEVTKSLLAGKRIVHPMPINSTN